MAILFCKAKIPMKNRRYRKVGKNAKAKRAVTLDSLGETML